MSSAVEDIVTGTRTVEQAFANMFKAIGKAFLDMVAQMLAQKAILMLLRAFSSGAGGSGGGMFSSPSSFDATSLFKGLSTGGSIQANRPYLVGEAGPELIVPQNSGRVVNNSAANDMFDNQMMDRYSPASSATINVESTVINNVEYVTMDQARAMTQQAATTGAQRGHSPA